MIYTFQDAVEHLSDYAQVGAATGTSTENNLVRATRRAVLYAYRNFARDHDWSYYTRRAVIVTNPPYSIGTVVYDHTGGTYERQLTLTGGTWPSWADRGEVIIAAQRYEVEQRKSDTVVTLGVGSNPGADVASTTYEVYQKSYPFVNRYWKVSPVEEVSNGFHLQYVSPEEMLSGSLGYYQPGRPTWYTFRGTGNRIGEIDFLLHPPPSSSRRYDMIGQTDPRPMNTAKYADGTVASSGQTITGTGTTWTASHVGCMLRISATSSEPDGVQGGLSDTYNPYVFQSEVIAVNSATELVTRDATSEAYSGKGYTLSDPVDIEPNSMYTAFLRRCEWEFENMTHRAGKGVRAERKQEYYEALREAMGYDNRHQLTFTDRTKDVQMYDLGDWFSG